MTFEPFAHWGKVFEIWQKTTEEAVARTAAFYAELGKAEAQRVEQAGGAIEEVAKLQKETLAYGARLADEMRKVSLDALQRAASFASSPGTSA